MNAFDVVRSALRDGDADAVPHPLLIEASAGTGKTWALAHLAVRFMVEDAVEPGSLLMVTFTRDAARELRGRVREHLLEAIAVMESGAPTPGEEWTSRLAQRWSSDDDRRRDLARARQCLGTLDQLQASTIHSFAAVNTLTPVGRLGDGARLWRQALAETRARWALTRVDDSRLVKGHEKTLDQVARALYDAGVRAGTGEGVEVVPRGEADPSQPASRAAVTQRDMALEVVARYAQLLRQGRETTFADLVVALAGRLAHHDAERFAAEMRSTFRVVMIDEFQDTDPLQWRVFRELFLDAPDTRLILVGDPKQAIYRFRSASVDTFLDVRDHCRARGVPTSSLEHNFRSTPQFVAALNALFDGADFHYEWREPSAEPVIGYVPVTSAGRTQPRDIFGPAEGPALHLRAAPHHSGIQREVLDDVAVQVTTAHAAGVPYREIAVLCLSNAQCRDVHRRLARRAIPSTSASEESVFECDAALHLRYLLAAVSAPEDVSLTEALRATWFAGPGAADPGDTGVGQVVARLAASFETSGVAALGRYLRSRAVAVEVARRRDGERHLTDLAHLAEVMVRECRGAASPSLVLAWLDNALGALDLDENVTSRRLETESDAVRVLTVHKSKGLEFDVVLAPRIIGPFREVADEGRYALRHWVEGGRTVVDAGSGFAWGSDAEVARRTGRTEADGAGEQRRLVYVALTRARRAAVAWVTVPYRTPFSGEFMRLLFDREVVGPATRVRNRSLADVRDYFVADGRGSTKDPLFTGAKKDPARVLAVHFASVPAIEVTTMELRDVPEPVVGDRGASSPPLVARRAAPRVWERRRWSYSDVARDLSETAALDGVLEEVGGTDEATLSDEELTLRSSSVRPDVAGVFGTLAGARLGVAVHRVLERAVAAGPGADVGALVAATLAESGEGALVTGPDDQTSMRTAIARVLARPLGATLQGRALDQVDPRDAATEMRFLLSLGTSPRDGRLTDAVDAVLAHDRSGAGRGLFADYFSSGVPLEGRLSEGYLVGSLDLTVRGLDGAYRIVDYKTDQLAGASRPYGEPAMVRHMVAHHYPLQALFYSVALHRFLRHRLVDYDPVRHLGGVDYYFVRVVGDASAEDHDGLLHWAITPAAVVAASDAMGGP